MKRVLVITALILASVPAMAQHRGYYGHRHNYGYYGGGWVAPLILGGVAGYVITRQPDPVIVQQPPVVVSPPVVAGPPVVINNPNCGPWTEIQQPDGTIVRQRTCSYCQRG